MQQPIAKDLRMIAACLKILTDIEREGDQCADVCEILSTGQVYGNSLIVSKIIQMMEEKKMDFLRDTNLALARMRAKFDERDEQMVYEKGIAKGKTIGKEEGKLEGQKMLVKLILRQRMTLNEWEEKQIDELDEEKLLDLIQSLDAIHTSEDFQRQIHDKTNQNVHMKQTVLNR